MQSRIGIEIGGGYLMLLDADDLVSNRIADMCESCDTNGFVSGKGYLYFEGSRYLRIISEPWKICGSCTIVNWGVDELPSRLATDIEDLNQLRREYVVNASHARIPSMMAERGRQLTATSFPITIYSCANGENISIRTSSSPIRTFGKRMVRALHPLCRVTPAIIEEFSLYPSSK